MYPLTYMNKSGEAVKLFFQKYGSPKRMLVIHDDIDMPLGKVRLKLKGGHGGHNGIKSIMNNIGHGNFFRIKIGIGRPENKDDIPDYVLSPFNPEERIIVDKAIDKAVKGLVKLIFNEDIVKIQGFLAR